MYILTGATSRDLNGNAGLHVGLSLWNAWQPREISLTPKESN